MSARRGQYGAYAARVEPFLSSMPKTVRQIAEEMGGGFTTRVDMGRVANALVGLVSRGIAQRRPWSGDVVQAGDVQSFVYWRL